MISLWELQNESLSETIASRSEELFEEHIGKPQLELYRLNTFSTAKGHGNYTRAETVEVNDHAELKASSTFSSDAPQIFIIRQERTWDTLHISKPLLRGFMDIFSVFAPFWRVILSFGVKLIENELVFPAYRCRRSYADKLDETTLEIAYVIRRVELHGRTDGVSSPFSIRQTGVYHRLVTPARSRSVASMIPSVAMMIAPSAAFEDQLLSSRETMADFLLDSKHNPWRLHILAVNESVGNWPEYMAWIETQLRDLFHKVVGTEIEPSHDPTATRLDFGISFNDRQALQALKDRIFDLQMIFRKLRSNIDGLRDSSVDRCTRVCTPSEAVCGCADVAKELSSLSDTVDTFSTDAQALKERAESISSLLSSLLECKDHSTLSELAQETHDESVSMHNLAERSTQDAAAMKALTVISLVYLPTTIVANFFSTEFIKADDQGRLKVSANVWLLAAISIPLTAITVSLWILWIRCTRSTSSLLPTYQTGARLPDSPGYEADSPKTDSFRSKVEKWYLSPASTVRVSSRTGKHSLGPIGVQKSFM